MQGNGRGRISGRSALLYCYLCGSNEKITSIRRTACASGKIRTGISRIRVRIVIIRRHFASSAFYTTVPIIRPLKVQDRLSRDGRSVHCQAVITCHRFSCSNLHLLIPIRHAAYLQGFSPHKHGLRRPHALHY